MTTYFEVAGDISNYEAALRNAESLTSKTASFITGKWGLVAVGIGIAAGAYREFMQAVDAADKLNKLSQSTGIAVEELSSLGYASDLAGVSLDETARAVNLLSRNMADAAKGSEEAKRTFDLLSISLKNENGTLRSTDAVLAELADKFSRIPDGATKTTLAMELFGKGGAAMIPLLNQGAAGLEKMRNEAESLGLIISGPTAQAAENLNDNMARLNKVITGGANVLLNAYVPAVEAATKAMVDFLGIGGNPALDFLEKQKKTFEHQLTVFEGVAAAPGQLDKYLSWIPGFVTKEQAEAGVEVMRSRLKLITQTIENMKAEAGGGTIRGPALDITIPDYAAQKRAEAERKREEADRLRAQEQGDMEMIRTKEDMIWKQTDLEKFMAQDLENALYDMRQKRLEDQTGFAQENLALYQWEHDAALQIAQTTSDEEDRLARHRKEMIGKTTNDMLENWMYFFQYFGKENKAAFVAYKGVAIAQTIIDTYKAAQGSYSAMASIPYIGPALGAAAAAAAIAAGMARVAAISSTEPGGGSGSGGGSGGSTGVYSASPASEASTSTSAGGETEQRGTLTINIHGDFIGDEGYVEMLAEKISKAVEDRDVKLIASDAKYAQGLR